ncbi:translocation/assembly module TamB domain-containing protein [Shewanella corallii]|uniref:Translocation/assembly module TamB domain-containing protein n=1 Tax=Shewanella corallii TaxID=560080 RepID=A0ABT0N8S1_9GAMM|nr:translocation/assembly module TamB domain-containing protein [Shewanella corallii]MCL2914838.1 translocation/assembly module TamB domain-containing protein [Shewanella corallii]
MTEDQMSVPPAPQQQPTPSVPTKKRGLIGRIIKNVLRFIIYLPLLLLVTLALLIGTSFGSRIAVMLADSLVPNLDLEYQSGRLNKDITLSHAHWSMDGVSVDANDLHLAWRPACLLNKQICVNNLETSSVEVVVTTSAFSADPAPNTQPDGEPEDIAGSDTPVQLPFSISLTDSDLKGIQVSVDQMQFNANRLSASADWPTSGIRVHKLESEGLLVDIPLGKGDSQSEATDKSSDQWALANLPKVYNPVPVIVEELQLTNSLLKLGERKDHFAQLSLTGEYLGTRIRLQQLEADHDMGSVSVSGNITLDKHYPMDINAKAQLNQDSLVTGLGNQSLALDAKGDFTRLVVTGSGKGDTDFTLNLTTDLADATLPYTLALSAKALRWPLNNPEYRAHRLNLHTKGTIKHQSAVLSGDITTPFYPQTQFAAELNHGEGELKLPHLQLVSGDTTLHLAGDLGYRSGENIELNWQVSLDGNQLNPGLVSLPNGTALPKGRIKAELTSTGQLKGDNWQVSLPALSLYGLLDGYPLDLTGSLSLDNKLHFAADNLQLKALGASLIARGSTGEQWDLTGHLDVPSLSPWMKDAKGSIKADLRVTGKEDAPRLTLDGQLANIRLQQLEIDELGINAWVDLMGQHAYNLAVGGEALSFEENDLKTLTLWSQGDLNKQKLSLTTQGEVRVDTRVDSEYNQDTGDIKGEISQLDIASVIGQWRLDKPLHIDWNLQNNQGRVSDFCLMGADGRLCLDKEVPLADKGEAGISFEGDPGAIIAPLMPAQIKWHGPVALNSELKWQPGKRPSANLLLQLKPGSVTVTRKEQAPATINYNGGEVAGLLNEDQLTLNTDIDAGSLASLSSRLQVSVASDRKLSGNVAIEHLQLAGLQAFVPQIETLAGKLSSQMQLSGTLGNPQVEGQLALEQGSLSAAANPTLLENIAVTMTFAGQQAQLDGSWTMGKGTGELGGKLDWQQGKASGDISIKGDRLEVIAPPVAIVQISPDLTISLTPQGTHVAGTINVPDGDIKIVQMAAGGVPLSPDVVFQDSISAEAAKAKPYPVSVELNVKVDDKVNISGMGLSGNLAGTLTLQQQPSRPPLLFGEIQVLNGSYRFLGQRLQISTGELQFVGPAGEPNLNIEAVRVVKDESGDVTAGIRITGTPARPQVNLFSNPAMEQAEILSYIIKGSGFNNKEQNDALMMSAALTLSTQLADGAIGNIGNAATSLAEKIGISDIQLDANDDGKVAISGYIGDRLMVKYGIGVFNPGYELTVRYYLLTRLYLEAVSGTLDQSLDLYYSFDLN